MLLKLQASTQSSPSASTSDLYLKREITTGDILAAITLAISLAGALIGFLITSYKDRQLRRKEYADKIRRAAGSIIAKLERWRELSLRFFEDIQPFITDADIMIIETEDAVATRDQLWRNFVACRATTSLRIIDEKIEIAYSDLYGYDPRIHDLYVGTIRRLKAFDIDAYGSVLKRVQADVWRVTKDIGSIQTADLGNALRLTCHSLALELEVNLNKEIDRFRKEMIKLIEAGDNQIVDRKVNITVS